MHEIEVYDLCKVIDPMALGKEWAIAAATDGKETNGLTVVADDLAPYFAECRAVVICRVMGKSDFDIHSVDAGVQGWYDRDGVHTIYHGEVVKVLVGD